MFWSRVFLPFALGYFVSQLFRSVNAVVSADLIDELAIDAAVLGTSNHDWRYEGGQRLHGFGFLKPHGPEPFVSGNQLNWRARASALFRPGKLSGRL